MAASWDMGDYYRGDTIPSFSITIKDKESGVPIIPESVCTQIRNGAGSLVHEYSPEIDIETGKIVMGDISSTITSTFKPARYIFDVQYTTSDEVVTTYLKGSLTILGDVSR